MSDEIDNAARFNAIMGGRMQVCPNGFLGHVCVHGICSCCGDPAIGVEEFRRKYAAPAPEREK